MAGGDNGRKHVSGDETKNNEVITSNVYFITSNMWTSRGNGYPCFGTSSFVGVFL